jgi:xanthine dehydrogenase YagS FAD-binding subunit
MIEAAQTDTRPQGQAAFDWPLALAAVGLTMNGPSVQSARVVIGYVAPIPWRSAEAERVLVGKSVSEDAAKAEDTRKTLDDYARKVGS